MPVGRQYRDPSRCCPVILVNQPTEEVSWRKKFREAETRIQELENGDQASEQLRTARLETE